MHVLTNTHIQRRLAFAAACIATATTARSQLLDPLLPAGAFTLSPAFDTFPAVDGNGTPTNASDDIGPLGVAFLSGPFRVLVSSGDGTLRLFGVDTPMGAPAQAALGAVQSYGPGGAIGLSTLGGVVYMTQQAAGRVVTLSSAVGSEGAILSTVATIAGATGITPFPRSAFVLGTPSHAGHLFVSGGGSIYEVDPAIGGGYAPPVYIPVNVDGIQVTPSGNYLMGSAFVLPTGGTGMLVWDISVTPPVLAYSVAVPVTAGPQPFCDGIAIGVGALAGKAYVNCTNGELWEVVYDMFPLSGPELDPPPFPGTATRIVYSGTRGDFVSIDVNVPCPAALPGGTPYGSLLFTQSSSIWRLDPPGGGWFGNPGSDQPVLLEPFESYCTAGLTSNGCVASMSATGVPSASASSGFTLTCSNVEGQKPGLVFYGVSGAYALPWGSGSASFLCVKSPTQRTPVQNTGGNNGLCNGSLSIDWRAFMASSPTALGHPLMAGADFYGQSWFRDPPAPKTTNLSNAMHWIVQP